MWKSLNANPLHRLKLAAAGIVAALAMAFGGNLALALLGLAAAAVGVASCLFLLLRPLLAFDVAIFLRTLPLASWGEADLAYTVAANGMLLIAVLAWLFHVSLIRKPIYWTPLLVPLLLFIAWAAITLLWAPDLIAGRKKLVAYLIGALSLFLSGNLLRTDQAVDGFMRVVAALGWTLVIAGFVAMTTDFTFGARLKVFGMNENQFGAMLLLMLPGVIWPVLRASGVRQMVVIALSIAYIASAMVLVLASGSRGSALSLVLMLLAFLAWRPVRPWGVLGVAMAVAGLMVAPFLLESLSNRFSERDGDPYGDRGALWEAGVDVILDYPMTGVGLGNGATEMREYVARRTTAEFGHDVPSHNPILEVGVETGLPGMAAYLLICAMAIISFFRNSRAPHMREGARPAYFPLVLCAAIAYSASWIKSGGMDSHPSFFIILIMLAIPSFLSSEPCESPAARHD